MTSYKDIRVIKHVFLPSGKELWTTIGREEYLISIETLACSCKDSFFKTLKGEFFKPCKHIKAYLAKLQGEEYETVYGSDDELVTLIKVISGDIRERLSEE